MTSPIQSGNQVMDADTAQAIPETKAQMGLTIRAAAQLPAEFWPDERISAIRAYVGKAARTIGELAAFLATCQRYDLDPMVGQLFLIDSKQGPRVTAGRDTWLALARREPGYAGHSFSSVHEADEFGHRRTEAGRVIVHHVVTGIKRGPLIGAYCVVRDRELGDNIVVRELKDYAHLLNRLTWQTNKADMMENRCIAGVFRKHYGFPGLLITGEDDELDPAPASATVKLETTGKGTAGLESDLAARVKAANAKREPAEDAHDVEITRDIGDAPEVDDEGGGRGSDAAADTTPQPPQGGHGKPSVDTPPAPPQQSFSESLGELEPVIAHGSPEQASLILDPVVAQAARDKAEQFGIWTRLELKGKKRTGLDNTMLEAIDRDWPEFREKYGKTEGK